jgi:zinc D-Ala-D-Ala carboxypeptidase
MYLSRSIVILFVILYSSYPLTDAASGDISGITQRNIPRLRSAIRLPVFYDDSSYLRFVSRTTPLSDRGYAPLDLVSISGSLINEAGRSSQLRKDARDALWGMASGFSYDIGIPLTVISGYRSATYQQRLWDLGRCSDSLCAPPGYSEHQLGLAIDLFDASSEKEFTSNPTYRKYVNWLENNAYIYGWIQSYQK